MEYKTAKKTTILFWKLKLFIANTFTGKERVALASYPRSGNSWLRVLLEKYTGEKSGTATNDQLMPGLKEGLIIKTHFWDSYRYYKAIHLIRNPYDAIYSYYLWKKHYLKDDSDWDAFVKKEVYAWNYHSNHWNNTSISCLLVRYEDLHSSTFNEMIRILEFLKINVDQQKLKQVIENSNIESLKKEFKKLAGSHFREGKIYGNLDKYSKEQINYISEILEEELDYFNYK